LRGGGGEGVLGEVVLAVHLSAGRKRAYSLRQDRRKFTPWSMEEYFGGVGEGT